MSTQNPSNKRAVYEDRAEELFQAGKVDTGLEQLELAWRKVPFADSHEVLGYTNRHLRIAAAYAHLKAGRKCLAAAENTLNGLKAKGQTAQEDKFLLAILHSRFDHIWHPKRSLEFFEDKSNREVLNRLYTRGVEPWVVTTHLGFLRAAGDMTGFDALLNSDPKQTSTPSVFEIGLRLLHSSRRLWDEGQCEPAIANTEAAVEKLRQDSSSYSSYFLGHGLVDLARYRGGWPLYEEAFANAAEAESLGRKFALRWVTSEAVTIRGTLLRRQGRAREALDLFQRELGDSAHEITRVNANLALNAAWLAAKHNRPGVAKRLLNRCESHLQLYKPSLLLALSSIVDGTLELEKKNFAHARRSLAKARKIVDQTHLSNFWCRTILLLSEAWLAYETRDLRKAVHSAIKCLELSKEFGIFDCEAQSILLQSILILDERLDRRLQDRLYERVLPRLGSIGDPELLLQVVANLYQYTWEGEKDIELSDLHLRQLTDLRSRIGLERFQELYQKHVAEPTMRRIQRRMFGA